MKSQPQNKSEQSSLKGEERIAKRIARAGICSRRDAEKLIATGQVKVNGQKLTTPAFKVNSTDKIEVGGKILSEPEPSRLWRFHKPIGLVTTHKDPEGRPTLFDKLPSNLPRVISIGRLDLNTEGLLLLTNDGELARFLELPQTGWMRRYRVRAFGDIEQTELDKLSKGIKIDNIHYGPIEAQFDKKQGRNCWLTIGLREGKNREIKRVLEHLGLKVNRLIRLSYGPFQLGELTPGQVSEIPTRTLKEQFGKKFTFGSQRETFSDKGNEKNTASSAKGTIKKKTKAKITQAKSTTAKKGGIKKDLMKRDNIKGDGLKRGDAKLNKRKPSGVKNAHRRR